MDPASLKLVSSNRCFNGKFISFSSILRVCLYN